MQGIPSREVDGRAENGAEHFPRPHVLAEAERPVRRRLHEQVDVAFPVGLVAGDGA